MSYSVATFNVGSPVDYRNELMRTGKHAIDPEILQQYEMIKPLYEHTLEEFSKCKTCQDQNPRLDPQRIISSSECQIIAPRRALKLRNIFAQIFSNSALILLQKVKKDDIAILKTSLPTDFEYVYGKDINSTNTFVIWNTQFFSKISPEESETTLRHIACVRLKDNTTQNILQIASVYIKGFNHTDPQSSLPKGEEYLRGDSAIENLLARLKAESVNADLSIIGGNFNAEYNHSNKDSLTQRRFTLLTEEGFQHVENELQTAFSPHIECEDNLTVLDHLFVRCSEKFEKEACANEDWDLICKLEDLTENPSEHRPVYFNVTLMPN